MRRCTWWVVGCLAVGLTACGGGGLTATEYAESVEQLVAEMEARFVEADTQWESEVPTRDGALRYWAERLDIRHDYLEDVEALQPPSEIAEMHAAALSVFHSINGADEVLAARVAEYTEITDHRQWIGTAEGQASLAVLEEVYAFCRSSQEELDATANREPLEGVPWLPPEMSQVVKVAFGCPP